MTRNAYRPSSSATTIDRLFGVPTLLTGREAIQLVSGLSKALQTQLEAANLEYPSPDLPSLLSQLRYWFDPIAKGERIRKAIASVPTSAAHIPYSSDMVVIDASHGGDAQPASRLLRRLLVTPEGCVVLRCFEAAVSAVDANHSTEDQYVRLTSQSVESNLSILAETYREWSQARIRQTVALLNSEPSTLRPAAAGLLLVLLINRNTALDRALPRPKDHRVLELVSDAIGQPALAYAHTLTGTDRATAVGVDLYRGWALGELTRRLGSGFHTSPETGIYLESGAEEVGLTRLAEDVARRPASARRRVPAAIDAALDAYDGVRPVLAGLSLAYDRPSNTRRIREMLLSAAEGRVVAAR